MTPGKVWPDHVRVGCVTQPSSSDREQSFERSYASLDAIFTFLREFLAQERIDMGLFPVMGMAVEEIFTNMVKYTPGKTGPVSIRLGHASGELAISLTDIDADRYDITQLPEVDVTRPLEERRPGGLGIHLVRKMMDRVEYEYVDRRSTITVYKQLNPVT